MSLLGKESLQDIFASCKEGASETAQSIARVIENDVQVVFEEPIEDSFSAWRGDFGREGIAVRLDVDGKFALAFLTCDEGSFPEWCAPDNERAPSKLNTLAQELGMTLLPESLMPTDFSAQFVEDFGISLERCRFSEGEHVRINANIEGGSFKGKLILIFPVEEAGLLFNRGPEAVGPVEQLDATPSLQAPTDYDQLPALSRSWLKIEVPLVVRLANTRLPVGKIVELAAGSIIQFDKSCEETLTLEIGSSDIAEGEVVKVGEKFGLRITSMVMPPERFFAAARATTTG